LAASDEANMPKAPFNSKATARQREVTSDQSGVRTETGHIRSATAAAGGPQPSPEVTLLLETRFL
jgi:hypothetical protein